MVGACFGCRSEIPNINYYVNVDTANFPLTPLATAIVFPIVFSINSAYKRREAALDDYGAL